MKKLGVGFLFVLIVFLTGCLDEDGYSLSDMWVGFGVLQADDSDNFIIVMDNNDVLLPVASNQHYSHYEFGPGDSQSTLKNGDRVFVNYTILDNNYNEGENPEFYVKLNSLKKILMKGILDITPVNEDSIGNDPVIVQDYWLNDSLLTFKIKYWGNNKTHFINLVKQPGDLSDSSQPIELELRHNDNNDSNDIPFAAYVSFKLTELEINGLDSVRFNVNATDYEGEVFLIEETYVYGESD